MRFSIRSALAIIAVYGSMFALTRSSGVLGIFIATVTGTTISAVIILSRRKNLAAIVRVTIGSIFGAIFGVGCLGGMILSVHHGYDHGFGESISSAFMGGAVGTIAGGLIGSYITQSRTPPTDSTIGHGDGSAAN